MEDNRSMGASVTQMHVHPLYFDAPHHVWEFKMSSVLYKIRSVAISMAIRLSCAASTRLHIQIRLSCLYPSRKYVFHNATHMIQAVSRQVDLLVSICMVG